MTFTAENIFFLGAVLIFASIVISKWGYRFGVPTLLLFLFTGMLFGSDGLGLEFNSHEDAQLIGMLSLSVILFSGGMDTKRRDIEPVASQGLMLSTVGVLITTVVTGLLIYYLSEWTPLLPTSSTSPPRNPRRAMTSASNCPTSWSRNYRN